MSDKPLKKGEPGTSWNDPKVPGLRLRYLETKAVYYLYYRTRTGKQRNHRVGDERVLTLTGAREQARALLQRVANGEDPGADKSDKANRATMQMLKDWHLERHADQKNKKTWRDEIAAAYDNHILKHWKPETAVADVTLAQVSDLHHKMRKTPTMANRVMSMLHKAFNLSETWGWRPKNSNPVDVERYKETKRRRHPQADEAVRLLIAMDKLRKERPWFIGLVELLCFTGARLGEIKNAKWEWVKDDGLHLPDSKTGEKVVPLSSLARDVLATIPQVEGNPYIIVGRRKGAHLVNVSKPWTELMKAAHIENLVRHDLRRFFASAGLSGGLQLSQVGELLGHMEASTTKRYAFLLVGAAQIAADTAADNVKAIMTGGGNVVPLRSIR
ncbi:site-specific integrase [Neorhizobium sp. T786]|uniref:tyrosine-type recombinase/integrase n=1 Tax=Pseudorhizobium xiangyangii TaxID=2883104 RepID=UPI001CFFDA97|nr:site-specific integrase [Neorhizobium xiangyangii]MCB5201665.1 site-specific integrase [Neorhizobium xiangyangii]